MPEDDEQPQRGRPKRGALPSPREEIDAATPYVPDPDDPDDESTHPQPEE